MHGDLNNSYHDPFERTAYCKFCNRSVSHAVLRDETMAARENSL